MSLRAGDDNVIPLCYKHHAELHTKFGNEEKFFIYYGMDKNAGKEYAKNLWLHKIVINNNNDTDLPF